MANVTKKKIEIENSAASSMYSDLFKPFGITNLAQGN